MIRADELMTAEARTTEGKNSRVIRAGPWDDFMQRRGNGDDDGRSAGQGKARQRLVRCNAVHYSAAQVVWSSVGRLWTSR